MKQKGLLQIDMLPSRQTSKIIKTCLLGGSMFMYKRKISAEDKIYAVNLSLDGRESQLQRAALSASARLF